MSEAGPFAAGLDGLVDALRQQGAQQFDPVRFHYITALARRAGAYQGSVRRVLDAKLEAAAVTLRMRLEQSQRDSTAGAVTAQPSAVTHHETLGDLVLHLAQHAPDRAESLLDAPVARRPELKSVRYFRNTWSKLSVERQVNQALGQAPKNGGPINSHVVALRALAVMRDTSPDYLNRFMSYMDTLLCLEQGDRGLPLASKTARAAKRKA
jgi:hypothetical protein